MTRSNPTPARGIATTFAGVRFRSRLEARWAVTFTLLGWSYEYEPMVKTAIPYLPDFWLESLEVYCEIKPWRIGSHYQKPEWPELRSKIQAADLDAPVILLGATYGYSHTGEQADFLAYGFPGYGWYPGKFPITKTPRTRTHPGHPSPREAWTEAGNKTRWRPRAA